MDLNHLVGSGADHMTWSQMSIRAAIVLLYGIVLIRLAAKRMFGKWGAIDIVVSVIVGSNLSRALTGGAPLAATLIATTVLVALHGALTWAAARAGWLGPLLKGRATKLVVDGRVDEAAMRRAGLGPNDLEDAFRTAGVSDIGQVAEAWIERNGQISVIRRQEPQARG